MFNVLQYSLQRSRYVSVSVLLPRAAAVDFLVDLSGYQPAPAGYRQA